MTPEMAAAAWEGLATNPAAQMAAEGNDAVARWLFAHDQVAISRARLAQLEDCTGLEADLLARAWGLIANAGWDCTTGRVDLEKSPGWHEAAIAWREDYHATIGEARP